MANKALQEAKPRTGVLRLAGVALVALALALGLWALDRTSRGRGTSRSGNSATEAAARAAERAELLATPRGADESSLLSFQSRAELTQEVHEFCLDVSNALRSALQGSWLNQQYEVCKARRGEGACQRELSAALYGAISAGLDTYFTHNQSKLVDLYQRVGDDVFWSFLGQEAVNGRDAVSRVAALSILRRTPDLEHRNLPPEAYRGLVTKTDPEVQLTLLAHRLEPLPSGEAKAEASALALSVESTPAIRAAAIEALGHPDDARLLEAITRQMVPAGQLPDPLAALVLPKVLERCGQSCFGVLHELAARRSPSERRIAHAVLQYVSDPEVLARLRSDFGDLTPLAQGELEAEIAATSMFH